MHDDAIQRIKQSFEDAVSQTKSLGVDHLLLRAVMSTQRGVSVFERKPHSMEIADELKIGVTVGVNDHWTSSSIENPDTLLATIKATREAALFADTDPDRMLADNLPANGTAKPIDPRIVGLTMKDLESRALEVEAATLDASPDIKQVPYAGVGFDVTTQIVCNSRGVWRVATKAFFQSSVSAVAHSRDERPVNGSDSFFCVKLDDYNGPAFARDIAQDALDKRDPRSLKSGRVPVMIHPRESAHLLGQFWSVFGGDFLQKKMSKLEGKIGQSIASSCLTLTDSPKSAFVDVPFDAEGSPGFDKYLIEEGVFRGFLHNLYTAKKTGMKPTANASGGLGALPGVAPSNLSWGGKTTADLLKNAHEIFYVTDLAGASASPISGDFSYGATGFWIKNGQIDHAVADVTLAGNFFDLLMNIEAIGDDLVIKSPHGMGSTGGRTLLIKGLDVSGNG